MSKKLNSRDLEFEEHDTFEKFKKKPKFENKKHVKTSKKKQEDWYDKFSDSE